MKVSEINRLQRQYFNTGKTRELTTRRRALETLQKAISDNEKEILEALTKDLGKAPMEGYLTEVSLVQTEIKYALKHLNSWARPKKVKTPIAHFPSKSIIYKEPYGVALVLSPWNYPIQLCLAPVVGAIAAGNCVIIKPSKSSMNVATVLEKVINRAFEAKYIYCLAPNGDSYDELLAEKYDYILFTGSERVGKWIMESAARTLTPVTLELGGKSPCIVTKSADIDLAAKRIAWGKFLNAGQTCVAPDYILVHKDRKAELLEKLKKSVVQLYGAKPLENPDYPKIITQHHYHRLLGLTENEKIVMGGMGNEKALKIVPTILDNISFESKVMQEEIFGPILPVITFDTIDDVIDNLIHRPHPLALYLFTKNKQEEQKIVNNVIYGGGCINDVVVHLANHHLPFGGVGSSGMGAYHGKKSFDTFTHEKGVLKKALWLDVPLRYAPYTEKGLKLARKIMK